MHDNKKKTIFYDNAVIKVYDLPTFLLRKIISVLNPSQKRSNRVFKTSS